MRLISEWTINIIIFLIFAMIIDMLLPDSNMKKYVKLVTGLLLLAIIITPIFKLLSTDFEDVIASFTEEAHQSSMDFSIETKKKEIQANLHAYTLEQMAVQMKKDTERELIEQFGMSISNIQISARTDREPIYEHVEKVIVQLEPYKEKSTLVEVVNIQVGKEINNDAPADFSKMKEMLSDRWEVPKDKLEILARGGPD